MMLILRAGILNIDSLYIVDVLDLPFVKMKPFVVSIFRSINMFSSMSTFDCAKPILYELILDG